MTPVDPTADARDRVAAVGRLEATAVGSPALQRLTALAVQLLGADAAQVSLFGVDELVLGGTGLPQGTVGIRIPLAESLCAVTTTAAPEPVVAPDARLDPRLAGLPPVVDGTVAAYLGRPARRLRRPGGRCPVGVRPRAARLGRRRRRPAAAAGRRPSPPSCELAAEVRELESSRLALRAGHRRRRHRQLRLGPGHRAAGLGRPAQGAHGLRARTRSTRRSTPSPPPATPTTASGRRRRCSRPSTPCGEYDAEFRVVLPSGETRWVQGRGRALADDRGVAVRLVGAAYDTTAQRHADARVARVMESVKSAFFTLDRDWRFTYVNAEGERVLQTTREELLGAVDLGGLPGRGGQRRSRCTTARRWRPARSRCSRPSTPLPSTRGSRSAPGPARTGCRSTSST